LPAEPLVSILVSNYNYARYIGESIQSALDQTYSNIELIICDDGSTDDSVRVIEEYRAQGPAGALIRKANGGQASGFNAAFAASRGEIIALLDSDDLFLPHKIERIVADFQAHPDSGFGVHRVIRMSADPPPGRVADVCAVTQWMVWHAPVMQDGRHLALHASDLGLEPASGCRGAALSSAAGSSAGKLSRSIDYPPGSAAHQCDPGRRSLVGIPSARRKQLWSGPGDGGVVSSASWSTARPVGAQKRFLATIDERLAEDFQPLSLHPYIASYELHPCPSCPGP
jgi:hypothetical protein